jgi:hypothetical protein
LTSRHKRKECGSPAKEEDFAGKRSKQSVIKSLKWY